MGRISGGSGPKGLIQRVWHLALRELGKVAQSVGAPLEMVGGWVPE